MILPSSELFRKILEEKEGVKSVEVLVIFSVTALSLAAVSWGKGFDFFVEDPQLRERLLKERQGLFPAVSHLVCKFKAVICLDALDGIGNFLNDML